MTNSKESILARQSERDPFGFYDHLRTGEKDLLSNFLNFLQVSVRTGEFGGDDLLVLAVGGMLDKKFGRSSDRRDIDLRIVFFSDDETQRKQSILAAQDKIRNFVEEKGIQYKQTSGVTESQVQRGWGGWRLVKAMVGSGEDTREKEISFLDYDPQAVRFVTSPLPERRSFDIFVTPINGPAAIEHLRLEEAQKKNYLILFDSTGTQIQ